MSVVIYENADVRATAGPDSCGDGLAVAGERVLAVGSARDLAAAFPRAARVDLLGLLVFPGLIDAHIHLIGYGLGLLQANLRTARSVEEAVRVVSSAAGGRATDPAGIAAREGRDRWILGGGWDKNLWAEDRFPTRHDLDPATGGRPAALTSNDGHLLWVNTAALEAAGVTRDTPDPSGGAMSRDATGEPEGILKEAAAALVRRVVPPPGLEALERATLAACTDLHRLGLTGVHAFTGTTARGPDHLAVLQRLHARGELSLRTVASVPDPNIEAAADAGMMTGLGDATLRVGPVKIFADGTLGSQTASMLAPFEGPAADLGLRLREPGEIDRLVGAAVEAGLWTAIHAIGDRANREALDALERHLAGSRSAGARHRIEHVQLLHPQDVMRLAHLGVTASMQPVHATSDRDIADRYWGGRAQLAYAWRSLADSGAAIAFGSDAPVETPDPWRGLYAATTRMREEEPGRPAWYPEQCLTLEEAFRAYTRSAAFAAGTEAWQGALGEGMVADFIVLDRDPYSVPRGDLLGVQVHATFVGGRAVHASGPLAGL